MNSSQGRGQASTAVLSSVERRGLPEQAIAEEKGWKWSEDRATAESSARVLGGGYKMRFDPDPPGNASVLKLTVTRNSQPVYSWSGHQYSVFVLAHDVLYLADFQPHDSGCAVIAYDLKGGRPLWKTHLRGLPAPSHSQYYNRINLEVEDGHLIAYGNESIGRYIELLDLKTGEMVGQRLLGRPGGPNP